MTDRDDIILCGRRVPIGTPVVPYSDTGGYDAYRHGGQVARHFGLREGVKDEATLRHKVDQIVLHYDMCGTSRRCFEVLQRRGLSVHFLLDLDGVLYQTLDLQERAWHATVCNARSIGVEIANIGSYALDEKDPLGDWYAPDGDGHTRVIVSEDVLRTRGFIARPARDGPIVGEIQGVRRRMYDFTPQQYGALSRLITGLCALLPRVRCDYPRATRKLGDAALAAYQGVLGHYHIQAEKYDPGPALQWEKVVGSRQQAVGRGQKAE